MNELIIKNIDPAAINQCISNSSFSISLSGGHAVAAIAIVSVAVVAGK